MHRIRWLTLPMAGTLALACVGQAATPLPRTLHGLRRTQILSGTDAAQAIARLHHRPLAAAESFVGRYEENGLAVTLYLSRLTTAESAADEVRAMADGVRDGAPGFGHYRELEVRSRRVYSVLGLGQVHFFYATGPDVLWVSAHPILARAVLAELLDVDPDSVPRLVPAAPVGAGTTGALLS